MVDKEIRRTQVFKGDGVIREFPFTFKLFASDEVAVFFSPGDGTERLLDPSEYSVSLGAYQDTNPGGTVTTVKPLGEGESLVVVSNVAYLQPFGLNNFGAFSPEDMNQAWDRNAILAQQLVDLVNRSLRLPETSTETAKDLVERLSKAQEDAAREANRATEAAESAANSASEAERTKEEVEQLKQDTAEVLAEEADKQIVRVTQEGDKQVARLEDIVDVGALASGMACSRRIIPITGRIEAGTNITLPNGQLYVVGRNHLLLFYNDLFIDPLHFNEVGAKDTLSGTISLTFPVDVVEGRQDYITSLVIPLGTQETTELTGRVTELENALAELSRAVAYVQTANK